MSTRQTSFDWRVLSISNLIQEVEGLDPKEIEDETLARTLARDLVGILQFAGDSDIDLGHEFACLVDERNGAQ